MKKEFKPLKFPGMEGAWDLFRRLSITSFQSLNHTVRENLDRFEEEQGQLVLERNKYAQQLQDAITEGDAEETKRLQQRVNQIDCEWSDLSEKVGEASLEETAIGNLLRYRLINPTGAIPKWKNLEKEEKRKKPTLGMERAKKARSEIGRAETLDHAYANIHAANQDGDYDKDLENDARWRDRDLRTYVIGSMERAGFLDKEKNDPVVKLADLKKNIIDFVDSGTPPPHVNT